MWVGTLHPRTIVVWRAKRRCSVGELARALPLKWRKRLGVRALALNVYAPKCGSLRLVVTRNRHGATTSNSSPTTRGRRPHHGGFAQGEPLAGRDALSRRQAVCGFGGVPMPGGPGDGAPRRRRFAHLRRIADDAPVQAGELGLGQGALAVGGDESWRISTSTPQGLSTSSTSHRVSPVIKTTQKWRAINQREAVTPWRRRRR